MISVKTPDGSTVTIKPIVKPFTPEAFENALSPVLG